MSTSGPVHGNTEAQREREHSADPTAAGTPASDTDRTHVVVDRDERSTLQRQRDRFGGLKIGASFFGWLAAAGAGVLMIALLASVGAGIGLSTNLNPDQVTGSAGTLGIISAVVLLAVTFVAYFCGGYVAGRMARFNGARQGVGVWLWAIVAAVVVAALTLITGSQHDATRYLNGGPQIPLTAEELTAAGILTALLVLAIALVGAVLGGLSGMRFHRRIDRLA